MQLINSLKILFLFQIILTIGISHQKSQKFTKSAIHSLRNNAKSKVSVTDTGIESFYSLVMNTLIGNKFKFAFCTTESIRSVPEWKDLNGVNIEYPTSVGFEKNQIIRNKVDASTSNMVLNCSESAAEVTAGSSFENSKSFSFSFTEGVKVSASTKLEAGVGVIKGETSLGLEVSFSATQTQQETNTRNVSLSSKCNVSPNNVGGIIVRYDSYPSKIYAQVGYSGICGVETDWFDSNTLNMKEYWGESNGKQHHWYWFTVEEIYNMGKAKNVDLKKYTFKDGKVYVRIEGTTKGSINLNGRGKCESKPLTGADLEECKSTHIKKRNKRRANNESKVLTKVEDKQKYLTKYFGKKRRASNESKVLTKVNDKEKYLTKYFGNKRK